MTDRAPTAETGATAEAGTPGALSGITVLDFSHLLQGPFATQLLGDLGADIIKIERPGAGDMFRGLTFRNTWLGGTESPNFLAWNRNKRSLALNLKAPKAREIIMDLAKDADVVVQNFRPGVMERLGYGYAAFREVNPRIVYCSGSGYGEDGPYVSRPGQDMLIQGLTGIMAATGQASMPPTPVGAGFSDQVGAMNMVYAILAALLWRERSGEGQEVKINLMAGMLAHQNQEMVMALNTGRDFARPDSGIGHPGMDAPFGTYPTSDGWVTIAMSPFATLVEVLGDESLLAYDDPGTLFDRRDEVWQRLAAITSTFTTEALIEALLAADIWCGEVRSHLQAAEDPQVRHLGLIQEYVHPNAGSVKVVGPAIGMSVTPPGIRRPAPLVGEHTQEILASRGFSEAEIAALLENGVAGAPERA
ncbi:MAG: CaiB/BaiF CoA-transferase family protein [Pseudomonadota bacterium]